MYASLLPSTISCLLFSYIRPAAHLHSVTSYSTVGVCLRGLLLFVPWIKIVTHDGKPLPWDKVMEVCRLHTQRPDSHCTGELCVFHSRTSTLILLCRSVYLSKLHTHTTHAHTLSLVLSGLPFAVLGDEPHVVPRLFRLFLDSPVYNVFEVSLFVLCSSSFVLCFVYVRF